MIPIPHGLSLKLVLAICAALALMLLIYDRNRWKATASLRQEQVAAEKAAHSATVADYRSAAERARAADAANAERVTAAQAAINERTANDYESRIAAARLRSDRLQREAATRADPGGGGAAPVPGLSASAAGVAEIPGEDRLSQPDALIATEQAIQLDELIKWIRRQAEVDLESGRDGGARDYFRD